MRMPSFRSLRRRRRALRGRFGTPLLLATLALLVVANGADAVASAPVPAPTPTATATASTPWTAASPVIAPGVTISGVPVGGLTQTAAAATVRAAWSQPAVTVRLAGVTYTATGDALGQLVYAAPAARVAYGVGRPGGRPAPPAGATLDLPVRVVVRAGRLSKWIAATAAKVDHPAIDASYHLVKQRPKVTPGKDGYGVQRRTLQHAITTALRARTATRAIASGPRLVLLAVIHPKVSAKHLPQVIVIDRSAHRLSLYSPRRLVHTWPVATGRSEYPTPLGAFHIVTKQKDPTWTPPDSAWAQGESAVGPGANNPLGTRWMGLSAPGIGIHGTPNPSSVGYSASHGCVRMRIPDVEKLFSMVAVGTPVHIVK